MQVSNVFCVNRTKNKFKKAISSVLVLVSLPGKSNRTQLNINLETFSHTKLKEYSFFSYIEASIKISHVSLTRRTIYLYPKTLNIIRTNNNRNYYLTLDVVGFDNPCLTQQYP